MWWLRMWAFGRQLVMSRVGALIQGPQEAALPVLLVRLWQQISSFGEMGSRRSCVGGWLGAIYDVCSMEPMAQTLLLLGSFCPP